MATASGADLAYPSVLPQCGIQRMKSGRKAGTHQNVRDVSSGAGELKDAWSVLIAVCVRAMVVAGDKLFVAGPPDMVPNNDPLAAFEGRLGVVLWAFSTHGGEKLAKVETLDAPPVYDGLIVTVGRLNLSTESGKVICFGRSLGSQARPGFR